MCALVRVDVYAWRGSEEWIPLPGVEACIARAALGLVCVRACLLRGAWFQVLPYFKLRSEGVCVRPKLMTGLRAAPRVLCTHI